MEKNPTIKAVADYILLVELPKRAPATQWKYHYFLGFIIRKFGQTRIDDLELEQVEEWIAELRQTVFFRGTPGTRGFRTPHKRRSFEHFTTHLNLIYRIAYEHRWTSYRLRVPNPDMELILTRHERAIVLSRSEIWRLWKVMNDNLRDQFVLSLECCMRKGETLRLKWEWIDLESGIVKLPALAVKTRRGREFKLSKLAWSRLLNRQPSQSPYVFPNRQDPRRHQTDNRTAWKNALQKAGIRPVRWHDLRHTALTNLLLRFKRNPVLVSEYAGVSLRTIQRTYLHSRAELTASCAVNQIEGGR